MYLTDFAYQNFEEEEEELVTSIQVCQELVCVPTFGYPFRRFEENQKQQVKIEVKYTHYIHKIFDNSARISLQK